MYIIFAESIDVSLSPLAYNDIAQEQVRIALISMVREVIITDSSSEEEPGNFLLYLTSFHLKEEVFRVLLPSVQNTLCDITIVIMRCGKDYNKVTVDKEKEETPSFLIV